MKLIYVYRKLGINVFLVNVRVVKDVIFIFFLGGGEGCAGG